MAPIAIPNIFVNTFCTSFFYMWIAIETLKPVLGLLDAGGRRKDATRSSRSKHSTASLGSKCRMSKQVQGFKVKLGGEVAQRCLKDVSGRFLFGQARVVGEDRRRSVTGIVASEVKFLRGEIDRLVGVDRGFRRQSFLAARQRALQSGYEGAVDSKRQIVVKLKRAFQ
jgi:hypothetical protein